MIIDRTLLMWYMSVCTEDFELLFLKIGGNVITWTYFCGALGAFYQINFVSRMSYLEYLMDLIEPLHNGVDDVFQFEHNLRMFN